MLINAFRSLLSGGGIDWLSVFSQILACLFIILIVLPIHEFAHGWVAHKLGDDTPKWQGRLTLNPLASLDPLGSLGILLFGIGWAKPVQINARNFKNPKRDMAITAAAGPISNILAAFVGMLIFNVIRLFAEFLPWQVRLFIQIFFSYYVSINIMLAVFNLLPIPPLDGSRIVGAFLSDRALYTYYRYQNFIMIGLFVLLFSGVLDVPLTWLQNIVGGGLQWLANLPFEAFGVL